MKRYSFFTAALLYFTISFSQSYNDSIHAYIDDYIKNHEVVTGDNKKYMQFYPVNENYRVLATFRKSTSPKWFQIETSLKQKKTFRIYGELSFRIGDSAYKLNVYQGQDLLQDPAYKDYLLVMFTDLTSGKETYEGGRYLDFTTSDIKNNQLVIDFNKAYNPYCAYEKGKYNCPIPPIENRLPISITAGEKIFDKAH